MNIKNLNKKINEYATSEGFSGMIFVRQSDNLLYERYIGYENEEKKIPFSSNSMFTIYSISKFLCSLGFMKLVDRGLVDIHEHPSKYLPEAMGFDERITIFHLLHHTSGINDALQKEEIKLLYENDDTKTPRELIKLLTHYPAIFIPGEAALYSNANYMILALIIENVTKMNYADYMKTEVFTPLGMKNSMVDRKGLEIKNRVQGYAKVGGKIVTTNKCYFAMFGAGDVIANAEDVYKLYFAIKDRLLVSEEAWNTILTPSPLNNMGCGCTVAKWHGYKRIVNNGGCDGFRAMHFFIPEKDFDVIILSNYGFGEARATIAEFIYEAFFDSDGETAKIEMDKGYI